MPKELDFTNHSIAELKSGLKRMFVDNFRERGRLLPREFTEDSLTLEYQGNGDFSESDLGIVH